jgi:hypothetical protein
LPNPASKRPLLLDLVPDSSVLAYLGGGVIVDAERIVAGVA